MRYNLILLKITTIRITAVCQIEIVVNDLFLLLYLFYAFEIELFDYFFWKVVEIINILELLWRTNIFFF